MSVADVGGGVPFGSIDGVFPIRFLASEINPATNEDSNATNNLDGIVVITAIDSVCTGSPTGSVQCTVTFAISGVGDFYYDTQTIGEGGGVHFHWRGLVVVSRHEVLHTHMTADGGSVYWSVIASGLAGMFPV